MIMNTGMERYLPYQALLVIMVKTKQLYTASAAAVLYFIVLILLQYFMEHKTDWMGAIPVAAVFWIVIFALHYFLDKRYSD